MTWTVIPDSDIDQDSPVTVALMTALRDNVTAAFNGDAGGPKLADGALGSTATAGGGSWVANRYALVGVFNVGTILLLRNESYNAAISAGDLISGSQLAVTNANGGSGGTVPPGTWRAHGSSSASSNVNFPTRVTPYVRAS